MWLQEAEWNHNDISCIRNDNKRLVFLLTFSDSNCFSSTCRKRTKYSTHFSTSKWQLCLLQAGWRRSRHIAGLWCVTSSITGSSYHSPSLWLLAPCPGQQNALSVSLLACYPSLYSSTCERSSTINIHTYLYIFSCFIFSAALWNSEPKLLLRAVSLLWVTQEEV